MKTSCASCSQLTVGRSRQHHERPRYGPARGFAFVEMASAADGEKAIAELNGTLLGGRALNVSEARPRPERVSGAGKIGAVAEAVDVGN